MFSGEDSIRIRADLSEEELEAIIEDAFDRLGRVRFGRRGSFFVSARRFEDSFSTTRITGDLLQRKNGEWRLSVNYTVNPSALCWVIAIVGILFLVAGVLIMLVPNSTKNDVQRAVYRALRDARDDAETRKESE
jgi:hypothetical protein